MIGLPPSRRRRLLRVWAVVTLVCLGRLVWQGLAGPPTRPFARSLRIDVNRADVAELMTLPGVGRTRALAIVLHRVRHGAFRRLVDLTAVDGIGPLTVVRLRPFLREPDTR